MSTQLSDFVLRDVAPERLSGADARAVIGRYRVPVRVPDVENVRGTRRGLKQWHYQSVTTPEWFLGLAAVQLGYVAQLFVYLVDRNTQQRVELTRFSPLGRALRFASSSQAGSTRFRSRDTTLHLSFERGRHVLELDVPLGKQRLSGTLECTPDEALALVFPLAADRLAYTHKAAGMRTQGRLRWGEQELSLRQAQTSLDYTRSFALRHTVWNWASFAGHTLSGKRFGLNLSARVYDVNGSSMENAIWLDGRVQTLRAVQFAVPSKTTEVWRISSADGSGEVALEVHPMGERRSNLNLGILRSVFAQPYGLATGSVAGERVEGGFGVVEDHDAVW